MVGELVTIAGGGGGGGADGIGGRDAFEGLFPASETSSLAGDSFPCFTGRGLELPVENVVSSSAFAAGNPLMASAAAFQMKE